MKREKTSGGLPRFIIGLVLLITGLLALVWVTINVHPDSATINTESNKITTSINLMGNMNNFVNNAQSDALSNITFIRKKYSIEETALVAPAPNPAKQGETDDPAVIQEIIDSANVLLEGQTVEFRPDVNFFPGSTIKYYCDDTILVICWKEVINGGVYSFSEVKIADGSQLRRAIADNTYGSSVQLYPTAMAKSANAVVAINGDFYSYRSLGITVYQRQLYRFEPKSVDSCFFTADGKMLFSHRGEMTSEDEAKQFITDNDVVFAVAFGPIIIENGELKHIDSYPIGEIDATYSRAAIAELGERHYLLAVLGEQGQYQRRAPLNEFAETLYTKNCINAYTLDGGQTATLVFDNQCFNRVDWDNERTMSDIIYFASAMESEG